jgi:hypothetical protein
VKTCEYTTLKVYIELNIDMKCGIILNR